MSERRFVRGEDGRPHMVPCPGCGLPRALHLTVLDAAERRAWDARHGIVDVTAAVLPPQERAAAMARAAETAGYGVAMPTISCVTCGYDGVYTFGAS